MGFSRQEYWNGVPFPSPCWKLAGYKAKTHLRRSGGGRCGHGCPLRPQHAPLKDSSTQGTLGPNCQGTGSDGATRGSLLYAQSASYSCLRARAHLLIQASFPWQGQSGKVRGTDRSDHCCKSRSRSPRGRHGRRDLAFELRCSARQSQPGLGHSAHPFTGMRRSHEKMGRGWVILFSTH